MKKDLEFQVGNFVFLKVSHWWSIMRFGKRGKLHPRYIKPYEILECIDEVAYSLVLPLDLSHICNVFYVSMLHKYVQDPSHVLTYQLVELD